MKVAIASNDRISVAPGHFGDSPYYQVIEILNARIISSEWRTNPYIQTQQGNHHGQPLKIIELLKDCSIFIGQRFGRNAVQAIVEHGIACIATEIYSIDEAISSYLDGQDTGFAYYNHGEKAFVPCPQRVTNRVES
jgi:predicted Fe-Mo cluster-binding NifX family protein